MLILQQKNQESVVDSNYEETKPTSTEANSATPKPQENIIDETTSNEVTPAPGNTEQQDPSGNEPENTEISPELEQQPSPQTVENVVY